MKHIFSLLGLFITQVVLGSDCLPIPSYIEDSANFLVAQSDVAFYGNPSSSSTDIKTTPEGVCITWRTEYSASESIKGDKKKVVSESGPYCFNSGSGPKSKFQNIVEFESKFLAFSKTDNGYRLSKCAMLHYEKLGDSLFRKQLRLKSANKAIQH